MADIELPPIYVYPGNYGLEPTTGGGAGPSPAQVVAVAQGQRDKGYVAGNWWSVFNNKLHDLHNNRPKYGFDGMLKGDFVAAHRADFIKATSPGTSDKAAWDAGRLKAQQSDLYNTPVLNTETELSGGIFTPLKAFAHFFMGGGTSATVALPNTGISPTPQKIPSLQSAIDLAGPGVTNVDINVPYDTKQDSQIARFYLGNITLNIKGQVTRTESGSVTFVGEARAFNDIFDANASTHRNDFDEAATTALRELQNRVHGIPYEISMPGAIPITYQK